MSKGDSVVLMVKCIVMQQ